MEGFLPSLEGRVVFIYIRQIAYVLAYKKDQLITEKESGKEKEIRASTFTEFQYITFCLTPSLNLNYPKLRLFLNSSKGLTGNALVKPSAT